MAPRALGHALELLGPDAADDATEAKRVRALLVSEYPRSAEARELKAEENRDQRSEIGGRGGCGQRVGGTERGGALSEACGGCYGSEG